MRNKLMTTLDWIGESAVVTTCLLDALMLEKHTSGIGVRLVESLGW